MYNSLKDSTLKNIKNAIFPSPMKKMKPIQKQFCYFLIISVLQYVVQKNISN